MSNLKNSSKQKSESCQECISSDENKLEQTATSYFLSLPSIKQKIANRDLSLEEIAHARQFFSESLIKSGSKSDRDVLPEPINPAHGNKLTKKKIIPNLAAVKNKQNFPVRKGLAFKEMEQKLNYKTVSPSRLDASLQPKAPSNNNTNSNGSNEQNQNQAESRNGKKLPGKLCKGLSLRNANTNRLGFSSSSTENLYMAIIEKTDRTKIKNIEKTFTSPSQQFANHDHHFSRLTNTPNTNSSFKLLND